VTWSLALAAALVVALAGTVCWRHFVERHYLKALEEGSVGERKDAARRLAAMGSRRGLELLLVLPSPEPPAAICEMDFYTSVLVEHGGAAIPLLLGALQHEQARARYRAAAVLQRLRPRGATRALVEGLAFEDSQSAMLNALAHQSPEPGEAIEALTAAIRSESAVFRAGAAESFRRVKLYGEDLLPARRMLERALIDPAPLVRIQSAWSLGDIGPRPESVPLLASALDDGVRNVRRAAARALAALGPDAHPARDALQRALADPGSDVRKYAAEALARIAGETSARPESGVR
jgi:HEAT repeat protein